MRGDAEALRSRGVPGFQGQGSRVRNPRSGVQAQGSKTPQPCRVRGPGSWVQGQGSRVRGPGSEI